MSAKTHSVRVRRCSCMAARIRRTPGRFNLIDPEGLASEPAHDLARLRNLNAELLAGDGRTLMATRCDRFAATTSAAREAIWQWSSIERVSTGLLLATLGERKDARRYLAAADELEATPRP